MKNKEKVMDNYLFNRKFKVSKTGLKILGHVALWLSDKNLLLI